MTSPASEAAVLTDELNAGAKAYARSRYSQGPLYSMLVAAYLAGARDAIAAILRDSKEQAS